MNESSRSNASKTEAAFVGAAERFLAMVRAFRSEAMTVRGKSQDFSSLAHKLSQELGQWLRSSTPMPPWSTSGAAFGTSWSPRVLSALPHGSDQARSQQRIVRLTKRLTQLQGRLGAHWREIGATAACQFVARSKALQARPGNGLKFENVMATYQLWIDCAEQAYGRTIRKDDFCRVQSELTNTVAALALEQRAQAEMLARALGMPTREEMDSLSKRVSQLQREVGPLRAQHKSNAPRHKRKRPGRRFRSAAP